MEEINNSKNLVLTPSQAEEFHEYMRQKRIANVWDDMKKCTVDTTKNVINIKEILREAIKIKAYSVKVFPNFISYVNPVLAETDIKLQVVVGGVGEMLKKTKYREIKQLKWYKITEFNYILAPSDIICGRFSEIKREVKKAVKIAKDACLKVTVLGDYPENTIIKLAEIISDAKGKYLSVEYKSEFEHLRTKIGDKCMLEFSGVNDALTFKKLISNGVENVVLENGEKIFDCLMSIASKTE